MAWGGARKGAGRRKPKAEKVEATVPAQPQRRIYTEDAIMTMIEFMKENSKKKRQRSTDWNPCIIRPQLFGPVANHIKANRSAGRGVMAMDANPSLTSANEFAVNAWMNGGMFGDAASEGLLFLGYPYLSEMAQRPEYRLFGEIRAEEMTRNWIDYRGTDDDSTKEKKKPKARNNDDDESEQAREDNDEPTGRSDKRNKEIEDKIKELKDFSDHLKLKKWFKDVAVHDSHFGIGHLYLDLKGADYNNPRDPENRMSIGFGRDKTSEEKLGEGCLIGMRTIEPIWCYPTVYNAQNPLIPSWYDPQVWYVMGSEIHKTRLLPFISRPVHDILKPAYAFGGLSMSQMAKPYVDIWLRTRESVGELIHAFSVMILSTNMGTITQPGGSGGGAGDVVARMIEANFMRDNQGMMVIDKMTEDFKNISAPISGLDELQAQAQEHLFSVGRIPAIKFTGIDPKGLNATSEGSLQAFAETSHAGQEQLFRTHLTTITDIMQISLWGKRDPDITFDFLPLQEMTVKEKAEVRKLEAETDQVRIDSGVISQEEARRKLATDPESGYEDIEPDDVPDLLGEEEEGLIPPGAGKAEEAELAQGGGGGGKKPPQADNDDDEPEPAPKPKKKAKGGGANDAADPFGATDAWNEGDHPRGQPGNAGQFGKGGGGSTSAKSREMPGIPDFLKKSGVPKTYTHSGQRLKMPQFGLTPTPWESHQHSKGFALPQRKPMPKSEGKPAAADSTVAFKPGDDHGIKKLNGVAFKSFDPPDDWAGVDGTADIGEPPLPELAKGMWMSSGCVITEPDGRVWLMRPSGGFGGYDQTFPKGGMEEGLSAQENAIKEVFEETGLKVRITGFAGDYEGDASVTRFFHAERTGGDPADAGPEAEGVILAPADKLDGMLNRTRDRNIAKGLSSGESKPALKPGDLEKVGKQMGSNEGGVFKDKTTGEQFYIKRLETKDHVKSEMTAARLYQLAGVNTLNYREVEGGNHVATELQKLDKKNVADLSPAERKEAAKDFAIHAWLANWDAAGTGGDNQGVVGGKVTTLDVGGSLRYRAQGGPKGAAFGNSVTELQSMRDPSKSYDAAKLYGGMDMDEITQSVKRVATIPDAAIRKTVGDDTALADTLIARKKDMAKRFGIAADAQWEESKHPRKPDGKFGEGGGSSGGGQSWVEKIADLVTSPAKGGSHYRSALSEAIKYAEPTEAKALKLKLAESWGITLAHYQKKGDQKMIDGITAKIKKLGGNAGELKAGPEPANAIDLPSMKQHVLSMMTEGKINTLKAVVKANPNTFEKMKKIFPETFNKVMSAIAGNQAAPENDPDAKKNWKELLKEEPKPVEPPKPKPQQFPPPTEAELAKAKKNVALQMQFIPGAKPEISEGEPAKLAQKIIEAFNDKYAGKTITDPAALAQKVTDFKGITAAINELATKENSQKAEIAKAAQAAHAKVAAEAAAKAKAEAAKHAEANKEVMAELGIDEQQAEGFNALAKMMGGDKSNLMANFKKYADQAKNLGYPINGFQCALIKNYSNGGFHSINDALRSGKWTPAQHVYVKMVNKALMSMPQHTGVVTRNTSLSPELQKAYAQGHIVQEDAFMSTSTSSVFSGNTKFKVTATGKRGASIKKLSNHPGEDEVLFAAKTCFHVTKVEGAPGGQMTIHMTEWDSDL